MLLHMDTEDSRSDKYSYCDICRVNHNQKRKHVYSKKHSEKLQKILTKFGAKIKEVQVFLKNPVIEEGNCDMKSNKFWCHFCKDEFVKHVTDNLKTILYGGTVEHLSSNEHINATEQFWRFHRLNEKKSMDFIISNVDLDLYKKKLLPLVDEYDNKAGVRTKQVMLQIRLEEDSRKLISTEDDTNKVDDQIVYKTVRNEYNIVQNPTGVHDGVRVWKGGIVKYSSTSNQIIRCKYSDNATVNACSSSNKSFTYTSHARGEGLTSVKIKTNKNQGNIHTGATPPWLCNDTLEETGPSVIGPSQADFDKHLEKVRKSKLNPNRVGANFDHTSPSTSDADWLPSFGRVWNDGARWKSREQYYTEIGGKKKKK